MIDALRPVTLMLATLFGWALLVLLLALTGMGGRLPPADAANAKPAALPAPSLRPVSARLGPLSDYLEVGARPLMAPDRRPAPVLAADGGSGDFDASLTSVLITPRLQLAIFTDNQGGASHRVKLGEVMAGTGWRLVKLEPRRATMDGPSGQRSFDLRVFDGQGGTTPTPAGPGQDNGEDDGAAAAAATDTPAATPAKPDAKPETAVPTQEEQVEAIRRRIEARRAQMRAEAARAAEDKR